MQRSEGGLTLYRAHISWRRCFNIYLLPQKKSNISHLQTFAKELLNWRHRGFVGHFFEFLKVSNPLVTTPRNIVARGLITQKPWNVSSITSLLLVGRKEIKFLTLLVKICFRIRKITSTARFVMSNAMALFGNWILNQSL